MFISRIRPHDSDTQRRIYSRQKAELYDSLIPRFVTWAQGRKEFSQTDIQEGVDTLTELSYQWRMTADQSGVD